MTRLLLLPLIGLMAGCTGSAGPQPTGPIPNNNNSNNNNNNNNSNPELLWGRLAGVPEWRGTIVSRKNHEEHIDADGVSTETRLEQVVRVRLKLDRPLIEPASGVWSGTADLDGSSHELASTDGPTVHETSIEYGDGSESASPASLTIDFETGLMSITYDDLPVTGTGQRTSTVILPGFEDTESSNSEYSTSVGISFEMPDPFPREGLRASGTFSGGRGEEMLAPGYTSLDSDHTTWSLIGEPPRPVHLRFTPIPPVFLPEPGAETETTLTYDGDVEPTDVEIRITSSNEAGIALNDPDVSPDLDVELAALTVPSGVGGPVPMQDDPSDPKVKILELDTLLSGTRLTFRTQDWGGWATVTARAKFNDEWVVAEVATSGTSVLRIPFDEDEDHIADSWEANHRVQAADPSSDNDNLPSRPLRKGDMISVYEEYRGFLIERTAGMEHVRTHPRVRDVLIWDHDDLAREVDEQGIFREATNGLELHRLRKDTNESWAPDTNVSRLVPYGGNPGTRIANPRRGYASAGERYGANLELGVSRDLDAQSPSGAVEKLNGAEEYGLTKEMRRAFIDTNTLREATGRNNALEAQRAIADPARPTAAAMRLGGVSEAVLAQVSTALDDPSFLEGIVQREIRLTVVHELMHTMFVSHHRREPTDGEPSCIMHYMTVEETLFQYVKEFLSPGGSFLSGYSNVCSSSPDICMRQINLTNN
ncbi:MAG: hypothetical protein HYV07_00590 [Deltaproteobacteria bacterium]|nr:hypothetical protein [Deltaproteobacteria bacterium]